MAWQRKIPFGYQMVSGDIIHQPEEADAVDFIFNSYLQGESYLKIADSMSALGIRYHKSTAEWNKHMVKRILENPKYAGCGAYHAIISTESWREAQAVRDRKTTGWKKQPGCVETVKRSLVCGECGSAFNKDTSTNISGNRWWHCSNTECGCTFKLRDDELEEKMTSLMNQLIISPELLDRTSAGATNGAGLPPLSLEAARMQNEINRELGKQDMNEDYTISLIFGCAAEKYDMLHDSITRREVGILKSELMSLPLLTAFDAKLFESAAEALIANADGTFALRIIGGNIISDGKEDTADEQNSRGTIV